MNVLAPAPPRPWSHGHVLLLIVALLAICLPQFLDMGLWADVTLYDICARNVLHGGIHYRDTFDTNLPGMVWLHTAIRGLAGWDFATLRLVDFLVVTGIVWLLARWLTAAGASRRTQLWTALVLFAFYFTTSEQAHCQRDVWMLLPALVAFTLRRGQLRRLAEPRGSLEQLALAAVGEGLCWGAAIWLKPHVLVPLLACQALAMLLGWRASGRSRRRLSVDAAGLLAGCLLVGALGVAWLYWSGTWPYFVDVLLGWDLHYSQGGSSLGWRLMLMLVTFLPWNVAHLVALPLAVAAVWKVVRGRTEADPAEQAHLENRALLGVLYLGWMLQAAFLQKEYEYVRLPLMLLALPLLTERVSRLRMALTHQVVLSLMAAGLALTHPMLQPDRLRLLARCCRDGNTPELRDQLTLTPEWSTICWTDLERVKEYLQDKDLHDGDLLCYNDFTHPLYLELNVRPAARYLHWSALRWLFPGFQETFDRALVSCHPRYIVTDLRCTNWHHYKKFIDSGEAPLGLPEFVPAEVAQSYPWCEPMVFRSGPYCVHRIRNQ